MKLPQNSVFFAKTLFFLKAVRPIEKLDFGFFQLRVTGNVVIVSSQPQTTRECVFIWFLMPDYEKTVI